MQQLPLFDAVEIPLTKGYTALVDPCDADLAQLKWQVGNKNGLMYAQRRASSGETRPCIAMHRLILSRIAERNLASNEHADHINGNTLDNRRSNLRIANHQENMRNRGIPKHNKSGFKGIRFKPKLNKWQASITVDRHEIYLGIYPTPEEAHAAYCEAARQHFGEFARTE